MESCILYIGDCHALDARVSSPRVDKPCRRGAAGLGSAVVLLMTAVFIAAVVRTTHGVLRNDRLTLRNIAAAARLTTCVLRPHVGDMASERGGPGAVSKSAASLSPVRAEHAVHSTGEGPDASADGIHAAAAGGQCRLSADGRMRTIWVMARQSETDGRGGMRNAADIVSGVRRSVRRAGVGCQVRVELLQSTSIPCSRPSGSNTGKRECGLTSEVHGSESQRSGPATRIGEADVLLAVSGPALDDLANMPPGARLIEVVPFGVPANDGRRAQARRVGVQYEQLWNRRDKKLERHLERVFGSATADAERCWSDEGCRAARVSARTRVAVYHVRMLLHMHFEEWKEKWADGPTQERTAH